VGEIGRVCAVLHHERELISMLPRQNSLQTLLKAAQHLMVPFTQRASCALRHTKTWEKSSTNKKQEIVQSTRVLATGDK